MRPLKVTTSHDSPERAAIRKRARVPYTVDEERELAVKAQGGDFEALEKLAEAYFGWIENIAWDHQNQGLELPELIEAGQRGFTKGLEQFDAKRGFMVHTIIMACIKYEIEEALKAQK